MGFLADMPIAFPGYTGRHPAARRRRCRACCATRATTRSRSASGTSSPAASARSRARSTGGRSGFGFERYYGFLQGDTNHWAPQPRARQPLRRATACARGRLPPHRGPRRRGDPRTSSTSSRPRPTRRSSSTSRSARCTRRTTSRRSGSSPTAALRRRVGAVARRRVRPAGRDGRRARRAPSSAERPSWIDEWDDARRRRAAHARARSRRCSPASSRHTDAQIGRLRRRSSTHSACSTTRS